ncbi:MAG: two-component regulator propeller domain-containing protein [Chitinophagaceae bacterium]
MNISKFRTLIKTILLVRFLSFNNEIYSQDWAKPVIKNQQRVDLRDLGYPMVNEIPANSSAVTSLITARSGIVYGCTSGEDAYLFLFDPVINKVRHLGKIPGHTGVHHSLVEDKDGNIYIGTGKNMFDEVPLSKWGENGDKLDITLWKDIKKHFSSYVGGHLFRYNPSTNEIVKLPGMNCELKDLGMPLANNSIYCLTINPKGDELYGLTYPDGHFFVYNIGSAKLTDLGEVDSSKVYHGPERDWRTLPRALICDDSGRVFTSATKGRLKYYDPKKSKLISTNIEIPGDYYYMQFYEDYTAVEYFVKDSSGLIYGGTTDGYLFSFDARSMQLKNLGKVRSSRRLRCLAIGKDGKIYIAAGERSTTRPCQFYSYNPQSGGFETLGLLIVDRSPYYYKRGQQFDCMSTGLDGTIYLGESERKSSLFLYIPQ